MSRRKVAKRPEPRTLEVEIEAGDFAGWWARARADFPTRWVVELNSGDLDRIMAVMSKIIVEHNMPDANGELATDLLDVDPYTGVIEIAAAIGAKLGTLPNR